MSASSDTRRLRRNVAAVEARYLRDLGRRERGSSRAAPPEGRRGYRSPSPRLNAEHGQPRNSAMR